MDADLFSDLPAPEISLGEGAVLLPGFATGIAEALIAGVEQVVAQSPFRHMETPGGFRMSVAMTNCGQFGWVTDRKGYGYDSIDPLTSESWPAMPVTFQTLAVQAAASAGYPGFFPDACLVNCYQPGARMSLHQDKNEKDGTAPIVSVSLGLPAIFMFGGLQRGDPARHYPLNHGDVAVWGGPTRFHFHGVAPLKDGDHFLLGHRRINLTFRQAL